MLELLKNPSAVFGGREALQKHLLKFGGRGMTMACTRVLGQEGGEKWSDSETFQR